MKRSPAVSEGATRALAFLFVFVFQFGWTVDAFGLHACPHHLALTAVHGPDVASDDAAPHGDHRSEQPESAEHPAEDGHTGACTCVTTCEIAAWSLPVTTAGSGEAPSPAVMAWIADDVRSRDLPAAPDHVLPFSLAPPRSA